MRQIFGLALILSLVLSASLLGPAVGVTPALAQGKKVTQRAGVDNTNMGHYRALAELSYQAFQKGDSALAAKLARILERSWDKGEEELSKNNPDLWGKIDEAMDGFVKPLIEYSAKAPEPAKVLSAYTEYLEKLKLAE